MPSENTWKDRPTAIKFVGGPRDGDEIEWTQPCAPRDRIDYHNRDKAHVYKAAARYSDDAKIVYYYAHVDTIPCERRRPDQPYYGGD